MEKLRNFFLVVCFFVCPLLFFTNLTRNPYITQISLLNIALCLAFASQLAHDVKTHGALRLARTPVDGPLAAGVALAVFSWSAAYLGHLPFYRPAIVNEGTRLGLFALINALIPFYLAAALVRAETPDEDAAKPVSGLWILLVLWGGFWLLLPHLRSPGRGSIDLWTNIWDTYAGFLWCGGFLGALWLCRRGRMIDFFHLALVTGVLASAYGVLQYFNIEIIWPKVLNPYGGRSVSTFGNPNFLSSYLVVMLPITALFFVNARNRGSRIVYAIAFLTLEAAVLCTLTRSSWGGAVVALSLLLLSRDFRSKLSSDPRSAGLLGVVAVVMMLFWPQSTVVGSYSSSVVGRITELASVSSKEVFYSPLYQRVLIWSCSWLMGAENPLTGKGWGLFELFYPFYQGHMLDVYEFFRAGRTHANNSHNEIMEVWAQTGVMGVGFFLWLWAAFFRSAKRHLAGGSFRIDQGLALAGACGVAGMLADNLLNVSIHFAVPAFLFWWAAGMVMGTQFPGRASAAPAAGPAAPKDSRMGSRTGRLPAAGNWRTMAVPRPGAPAAFLGILLVFGGASWYWVRVWNREVHYFAGFKLLRRGALSAAVKRLEASKKWGPPEVNSVYELGNAYARAERFEEADKTYTAALHANSGYDEIYFNMATIKNVKLGRREEALKYYRNALAINPLNNDLYLGLGAVYLQDPTRYAAEGLALLEMAVRFFPDIPTHWNNLGYLRSLKKSFTSAEEAYSRALVLNPDMKIAERNLRSVLRQSGHPAPPVLRGITLLRRLENRVGRKDYSAETLRLAAQTAELLPKTTKVRFYLGSLLLVNGRVKDAVGHLEWVAAREPDNTVARVNLGNAYLSLGRRRKAEMEFRGVLGLAPNNPDAVRGLKAMGQNP